DGGVVDGGKPILGLCHPLRFEAEPFGRVGRLIEDDPAQAGDRGDTRDYETALDAAVSPIAMICIEPCGRLIDRVVSRPGFEGGDALGERAQSL
ncbi:hypothetical protein NON27_27380, partial [Vibrio parahaemolyticus]|nr:hypothetical protein [Vibrio parahaemolyticus]